MTRYLLALFSSFFLCLLCYGSDTDGGIRTVVIDAGHGGKDPGAVSIDGKTYEKDFTLDIARRLAGQIRERYPDVRVILTRETDVFIPLDRRARIANDADADLFISIHINAATNRTSNGYSVHVLGESSHKDRDLYAGNLEVVKRENSVVTLEDGYKKSYNGFDPSNPESYIFMTMMQSAYLQQSIEFAGIITEKLKQGPFWRNNGVSQNPFLVLWKTSMPAVLVELGFISNADDLWALGKTENREVLSRCIADAFAVYKTKYDKPAQESRNPVSVVYGVQAFVVSKQLPPSDKRLLGYDPVIIKSGNLYKYIIGRSSSKEAAIENYNKIRSSYPDCFLVILDGENVKRLK